MNDIDKILKNLDEKAKTTIMEIALAMAKNRQSQWTGATLWTIHYTQGAVGDAVEMTERSLFRTRRIRSRGIE